MTEQRRIAFTVRGTPVAQGSMRAPRAGVVLHDNRSLISWRNTIGWAAKEAMLGSEMFAGAVSVEAHFRLERPSSVSREAREYPTVRKNDIDKLTRALLDALSGIAFVDDGHVCDLTVTRRYDDFHEGPGVDVVVEELR